MSVSFITPTQIIDHLITIINADENVAQWLEDNEFEELKIFDNPDALKPPGEEECPFIAIYRTQINKGERANEWTYVLEIEHGVKLESVTNNTNVYLNDGIRLVEDLGCIIYQAIKDSVSCNLDFQLADIEYDETASPLYLAYYGYTFKVQRVIGAQINL